MINKSKNIHWFPGHMKKAIIKISDSLKLVDFVVEMLDSRIPYSSQNEYIEHVIETKPRLYILTKADLADPIITKQWVKFLNQNGNKAIAVDLKKQSDYKLVLDKMFEFCKEKEDKKAKKGIRNVQTRAMIVGIPNVGKSTFINYLAKKSVTQTGNTPGLTKNVRWVKIQKLELMDTPGILEPQYEDKTKAMHLACVGSMKSIILPKDEIAEYIFKFVKLNYPSEFKERYKLESLDDEQEVYRLIAKKRGFLLKDGELDTEKAIDIFLNEFKNGIITNYSLERPE